MGLYRGDRTRLCGSVWVGKMAQDKGLSHAYASFRVLTIGGTWGANKVIE